MAYEQRPNSGTIFPNHRKFKDTSPDWTGTINVEGKLWEISGWNKEKEGNKRISLSVKPPYVKGQQRNNGIVGADATPEMPQTKTTDAAKPPAEDDDIPF